MKRTPIKRIKQNFQVDFEYSAYFTSDIFSADNPLLKVVIAGKEQRTNKVLCIVDQGVIDSSPELLEKITIYHKFYNQSLELVADPLVMMGGEQIKNDLQNIVTVYQAINDYGICRHSYVVAIGGGAFLDMVGFAAATAHRGVRLIRIPTTVLSQNDSGVGVKNGVNLFDKKNFIGSFAPPRAVINDSLFLTTLSDKDWRVGIAEAIKVALLKDESFVSFIEKKTDRLNKRDLEVMSELIYRCAKLHMEHIATNGDPFETGSSRPLDFGHWAAHKLEQLSAFNLRHGEAVSIGLAVDATYANLAGLLSAADWQRVIDLLCGLNLPIYDRMLNESSLLDGLAEFRQHLGGELTIILLKGIAKPLEVHEIDSGLMVKVFGKLKKINEKLSKRKEQYASENKNYLSSN